MTSSIAALFFLVHLFLFLLGFFLPVRYFKKQVWFQKLGKKLVVIKERQLQNNPLLKYFTKAIDEGSIGHARLIIANLVFLKSLGMAVTGTVGATVILVPIQAVMMASISEQLRLKGISEGNLSRVTGFQLATMIMGTVIGNLMGWRVFIDDLTLVMAVNNELYAIIIVIFAILISSCITATKEVRFYETNKTLIG